MPDGNKFQGRDFVLYFVEIRGSSWIAWKAPDDLELSCADNLPVPPETEDWTFVIDAKDPVLENVKSQIMSTAEPQVFNLSDAVAEWMGIFAKEQQGQQHRSGLFALNTAGANQLFIQPIPTVTDVPKFILQGNGPPQMSKSPIHWSLQRWLNAIRLSVFEQTLLNLIYTDILIDGAIQSNDASSAQLIYSMEGPLQLRPAGSAEWRQYYCVAEVVKSKSSSTSTLDAMDEVEGHLLIFNCPEDVAKCRVKKARLFSRQSNKVIFDKKKLAKRVVAKVEGASLAFAVCPEKKNLNSATTLFKLMGGDFFVGYSSKNQNQFKLENVDGQVKSKEFQRVKSHEFICCMAQTPSEMLRWIRCFWTIFHLSRRIPSQYCANIPKLLLAPANDTVAVGASNLPASALFLPVEAGLSVDMQHVQGVSDVFKGFWSCFSKFGNFRLLKSASKIEEQSSVKDHIPTPKPPKPQSPEKNERPQLPEKPSPTVTKTPESPEKATPIISVIKASPKVTMSSPSVPFVTASNTSSPQNLSSVYQTKSSPASSSKSVKVTKVTRIRYGSDETDPSADQMQNERSEKPPIPQPAVLSTNLPQVEQNHAIELFSTPNTTKTHINADDYDSEEKLEPIRSVKKAPNKNESRNENSKQKLSKVNKSVEQRTTADIQSTPKEPTVIPDDATTKTTKAKKAKQRSAKVTFEDEPEIKSERAEVPNVKSKSSPNEAEDGSPKSQTSFHSVKELTIATEAPQLPNFQDHNWSLRLTPILEKGGAESPIPQPQPVKLKNKAAASEPKPKQKPVNLNRKYFTGTAADFPEVSSSSSEEEEEDSSSDSSDEDKISKRVVNRRSLPAKSTEPKPLKPKIIKIKNVKEKSEADIIADELRREREKLEEERRQLEIQRAQLTEQQLQVQRGTERRNSLSPPNPFMMHANASSASHAGSFVGNPYVQQRLPSPTPSESASMIMQQHPNFQPFYMPPQYHPNPYATQSVYMAPRPTSPSPYLQPPSRRGASVVSSNSNSKAMGGGGLISAIITKEKRARSVAYNPSLGITHSKSQFHDIHQSRHEERVRMEREFREQEQMLVKQEERAPHILGYSGPAPPMDHGAYPGMSNPYYQMSAPPQFNGPYGGYPQQYPQQNYHPGMYPPPQQPMMMQSQMHQYPMQPPAPQPVQQPGPRPGHNRIPSETTTNSD